MTRVRNRGRAACPGSRPGSRAVSGIAGLASIPYLGALFSVRSENKDEGQVLLVLKPTIVRRPVGNAFANEVWTGTETTPVSPI